MTKTAVAAGDGDERRKELLAQIAAAITELGHPGNDPEAALRDALTTAVADLRAEVAALRAQAAVHHHGYCGTHGHCGHAHWYYGAGYNPVYTVTTGSTPGYATGGGTFITS